MPAILDKLLRIGEGKILRQLEAIAKAVNAIEDDFVAMSDDELRRHDRRVQGAARRRRDPRRPDARGVRHRARGGQAGASASGHFDVQIMGGAALHLGNIAEMKTGEGKTLVATLPSYLNALTGKGVHVVTVNDYLAKYHAEWMGRIHHFLGLTTGVILPAMRPDERREAYDCDITYGTNNELGFDYLRDNMAGSHRGVRPARPQLRDRRRGRLDPHRRGPHPADHQRPDPGRGPLVRRVRQASRAR